MKRSCRTSLLVCMLLGIFRQDGVYADGSTIDKIYHPYVQPLERELEFRSIVENNSEATTGDRQKYRLGYGQSLSDSWFGEIYLIGEENDNQGLRLDAYELEALWQITEQGEYAADWGLLLELEKLRSDDIMEFATALLIEKEWRRWSGTANLYAIYEFGSDIEDELETALALQARYRYSRAMEPAVEFYLGEDTQGLGPVIMGGRPLGGARQLRWEGGVIFGVDDDTPDQTFRLLLEYEF